MKTTTRRDAIEAVNDAVIDDLQHKIKQLEAKVCNLEQEKELHNKVAGWKRVQFEQLKRLVDHYELSLIELSQDAFSRINDAKAEIRIMRHIDGESKATISKLKQEKEVLKLDLKEFDGLVQDLRAEEIQAHMESVPSISFEQVVPIKRQFKLVQPEMPLADVAHKDYSELNPLSVD